MNRDAFANENRRLTVMVVNIEVNEDSLPHHPTKPGSLHYVQDLVEITQKVVYRLEGSFHKVISYDGGINIVCIWGMSPCTHEDDAARAVLTAFNLKREFLKSSLAF